VGLRTSGRRRTPGLRREEVATLAGVSIDYLVRLEQGRDTHPSSSVLAALAEALQLDADDRLHLARLAAVTAGAEMCPETPPLVDEVSPSTRLLLDRLDPTPAFVLDPINDIVASNVAWRTLAGPLGLGDHDNLAWHLFLHPDARTIYPDWDDAADGQVSRLRAASLRWGDHPRFKELIDELQEAPGFAERFARHPVAEKRRGVKSLIHPEVGELRLAFETLGLSDHEHHLVVWLPADEATDAAVDRALGPQAAKAEPVSPAVLRVVGRP
jgi:transcriptional regulator with XRE-family HTH domain